MGMRELAKDAISMRNRGVSPPEIRRHIFNGATELSMALPGCVVTEVGSDDPYEIGLSATAEVVRYSGAEGYSYRRR